MYFEKRQDAGDTCAGRGNQFPTCAPITTDTWVNGSTHEFVWNYNYPFFVGSSTIDLYLYYKNNFQYTLIKTWPGLPRLDGEMSTTVDDTWFPTIAHNENVNWTLYFYILPTGMNPKNELQNTASQFPRPTDFNVIQLPSPSSSSPNNNNNSNNNNNNNNNTSPSSDTNTSSSLSSGLPGWGIALIVLGCVALIVALGIFLWAIFIYLPRKKRNQTNNANNNGTSHNGNNNDKSIFYGHHHHNEKAESIYSNTPIMHAGLRSSVSVNTPHNNSSSVFQRSDSPSQPSIHQQVTMNGNTPLHSPTQAASAAAMLSDTYRQLIHRPDWTTTDEDLDVEKRRQLGDELLQRQLAEDGAMIKQTQPTRLKSITTQTPKARSAIVDTLSHSSSTTTLPEQQQQQLQLQQQQQQQQQQQP
ncbi:unnamed protein product [Cunninghamella echinulata]